MESRARAGRFRPRHDALHGAAAPGSGTDSGRQSGICKMDMLKSDFKAVVNRHNLFWEGELEEALVLIQYPEDPLHPPAGFDLTRWDHPEEQAETALEAIEHTVYQADALPCVFPNIGPDFFAAGFGGQLNFTPDTSHIIPFVADLRDAETLRFRFDHPYVRIMEKLYDLLLEKNRGDFLIELPDFHPGADCLVGWRGPAELCLDLFDNGEWIKKLLPMIHQEYRKAYYHFYDKLTRAGLPCAAWAGLYSSIPYGIPSCDFSYLISPEDFDEFFMPALIEECRLFPRNIFHVDGRGVLNHLDSILTLPNLQLIQWVFGAGNGAARDWIEVYRKCIAHDKAVQVYAGIDDLDALFAHLRPERTMLMLQGISTGGEAEYCLKRIRNWK